MPGLEAGGYARVRSRPPQLVMPTLELTRDFQFFRPTGCTEAGLCIFR